jgi:hypothetical protein
MPENKLLEQALQQLKGCLKSEEITHIDRLKVALCGDTGTGKSCLIARTARKPLLHYDFDDRRESIAGMTEVIIKTLVDKNDETPTAWNILESDIGTLEYLKSKNELPFKSLAFDSCTFLRKYAEHQFMHDCTSSSRNKFKVGMTNYIIPKDWDAVTGVQKMLDGILNRAFALDVDVYMTFHTRNEKDNVRSTKTDTVYKDNLTIDPPNLKVLLPKFNDKWRTFVDTDGKFKVQLHANWQFAAASVLKNIEDVEIADIQKLLEKHNKV